MRESALRRLLSELERRLDKFDAHGIASEEFRRSVYTLYEIARDLHSALREVESEFQDAYEAFKKIADQQTSIRARELVESIMAEDSDDGGKSKKSVGNYL
jgi:asparagine synthetase A